MLQAGIYFLKDSVQDCREMLKILRKRRRQAELVTDAMEDLSKLKEKLCFKIDDKTEMMEARKAPAYQFLTAISQTPIWTSRHVLSPSCCMEMNN